MRVDLRSDTVTLPSAGMRKAMAGAEVGDDVYGEDPTVNRLEERVADLLGVEAALFMPSGTMANQVALKVHAEPGDDVLDGEDSHNWLYESGAGAAIAGVQFTIVGKGGMFSAADVQQAAKPDNHHFSPTRLVCVENTHNRAGGRIWSDVEVKGILQASRALGLRTHLDGARIWNASVATGASERQLAAGFDTVSTCLSKGLGAPVGSVLCGSRELIHRAHRFRKMLGGGMRQAGVLAAAGLFALENHRERLVEDHANARRLAELLAESARLRVDRSSVQTNMVLVDIDEHGPTAGELVVRARDEGVLFNAVGPRRIRLVTHMDVSRAGCEQAAEVLNRTVAM
ncbi:MAG: low-specificity L-threonine aldolase [Deltaproteobacteria bacterium]|nr:low-specificity L-threonine aldolase [Deltaproteobacteria bacterium]